MAGFAVKRYVGNECGKVFKHHLSLVCPSTRSVFAKIDLPFDAYETVDVGSCHGLLYLQSFDGKIIVFNLTTQQMEVPPTPEFKPPPHFGALLASGLGYDAKSRDYKLIRNYNQYYYDKFDTYAGFKSHCQLYSFKNGSWKKIKAPDASLTSPIGVYLDTTGSCYWTACLGDTFGAIAYEPCRDHVMPFDFATESFGHPFTLPAFTEDKDDKYELDNARYKLVDFHGLLGVLVYMKRDDDDKGMSSSPCCIKVFVREEMYWIKMYEVALDHVPIQRPVGLDDGRFLFLEARHSREISQLGVYDLVLAEWKELGIYDGSGHMSAISYVESTYRLPHSEPISIVPFVETTDPPPDSEPISSDNKEERKTSETGRMLNKGPRMKTKSKRTKTKTTVSKNKLRSWKRPRRTTFIICESSQQQ